MLNDLWFRARALFRRNALEGELGDELQYHLDRHVEKLMQRGLTREEAIREARLALGGLEQTKEECREARGVVMVEALMQDIRYAFRVLSKSPGFTAAVTLSLALGIGANTAIFSLIDAIMWRILPVKDPAGLVLLTHGQGGSFTSGFTYQQYRLMRDRNQVLTDLAAYSPAHLNVSINGRMDPTTEGQLVSGNYFSLLGVSPIAGRAIDPADDLAPNGHPVAMISHRYWGRRFGFTPSVVGRTLAISGMSFTIIGITPPEFFGAEVGRAPDIFVPLMMQPTVMPAWENMLGDPIQHLTWVQALGRLKPGVHVKQAAADLEALYRQELPMVGKFSPMKNERLALAPGVAGFSSLRREFSTPLFILMGIVVLVLLIACANTATLLLARATARRSEFAMRLALGARRGRLVRQLLIESLMLAILGGLVGILLARWAAQFLTAFIPSGDAPIVLDLSPNSRVLLFAAGISIVTGVLFGLAPALRATRIGLGSAVKDGAGWLLRAGGLRSGKVLAVIQVAVSLVLLIGAGLFVRSLQKLNSQEAGFVRESVLVMRVEPKGSDQRNVPGASERLDRIYRDLLRQVEAVPGVRSAGMAQFTPTSIRGASVTVALPSGEEERAFVPMVYPGYFRTIGIPFLAGRDFSANDLDADAPLVAVVNDTFARRMFGKKSAAGQQFHIGSFAHEIIGVVRDSRYTNFRGETPPTIYKPFLQTHTGRGQMALYVRVTGDPALVLPRLREAVQSTDKSMPLFQVRTLAEEINAVLVQERLIATVSSSFGALALVLVCVGLYGLLAFAVVQRTREMGVRMALGATRWDVVWMVMREALVLVLIGGGIGVPAALAAGRMASNKISGLLFGLKSTDPLTIATAAALLTLVALVASYIPARRASRIEPMVALRNE